MDHAGLAARHHVDPGGTEPVGERFALVAQRIEFAGDDDRRWESRQVLDVEGADGGVGPPGSVGHPLQVEPLDVGWLETVAVGVADHRTAGGGEVGVGEGKGDEIGGDGVVPGAECGQFGQGAPGAVAGEGDHLGAEAEFVGSAGDPCEGGDGVVDRGGCRVLGRQPVVDRQDPNTCPGCEPPAGPVVGLQAADGPAASVQVDDEGVEGAFGVVEPGGEAPCDLEVTGRHAGSGRPLRRSFLGHAPHLGDVSAGGHRRERGETAHEVGQLLVGERFRSGTGGPGVG